MLKYVLLITLFFSLTACSPDEQPSQPSGTVTSGAQKSATISASESNRQVADFKLIFFINPDGGPCIMQNNILKEMADELSGKVDIQYVQTSVPADLKIFNQYGIRSLPILILADAGGKEITRLPPGVKSRDEVRLLLQSIPQS
jgi:thioredoxin 1